MGGYLSSPQILTRKMPGQFKVGCMDLMIEEAAGSGLFMRLFFPTDSEITGPSSLPVWIPRPEYAYGVGEYLGHSPHQMDLISSLVIGDKRVDCIDNAQLSTKSDKWPVLVFSHGLGGSRTFYSTYCTSLASHGYVVAAVEHRDSSACWTYKLVEKNGTLVEKPMKIKLVDRNDKDQFKIRNEQVGKRAEECAKAVKILEQLDSGNVKDKVIIGNNANLEFFKNKLLTTTASIIGHSFGGATSIASSSSDFQKAIVLDGWMYPLDQNQQEQAKQPIMFLNVGDWQWNENLEVMRKILPNNEGNILLTLSGAVHQSFTDFPFVFPNWLAKQFGVHGPTEPYLCMQSAIELTLSFLKDGKDGVQKLKDEKYTTFITNEIYGRVKLIV
ncbi:1-alkyl-2-acetylglycerophosphocholine esterase [Caenorhabditis elegans]|uniref:1-alkyl-2-acetylglycerophosphocholine esterase n=1 Tax=Caenorhabditis elegans TaxID=6239 RepID=G5EGT1_CAEEL|nr:1-alkyl-2-acetylglycerophosphocholine esterase [Caenorhabditis elegans]AAL57289.1 PAF-1 [Caenorhabditis elegans]CCD70130.1 1-alkyl-2-acetylglycerophosphocholine esterase [Caenorhabditis elegans]|eukprot:NP_491492.1 1-alkyl-2-acetylglycerophosphocholine esterase [Caenorhabditis elegans]